MSSVELTLDLAIAEYESRTGEKPDSIIAGREVMLELMFLIKRMGARFNEYGNIMYCGIPVLPLTRGFGEREVYLGKRVRWKV